MSSPDGTKVQVNFRAGEDLINVYAQDETDLLSGLVTIQNTAGTIAETGALLRGAANAGALTQPQPTQQAQPQGYPAATPTQPAPAPAPAPAAGNGGHACLHGARQFKSGNGARGPWAAWFCPTPQGDPNKCEPEWVKV